MKGVSVEEDPPADLRNLGKHRPHRPQRTLLTRKTCITVDSQADDLRSILIRAVDGVRARAC